MFGSTYPRYSRRKTKCPGGKDVIKKSWILEARCLSYLNSYALKDKPDRKDAAVRCIKYAREARKDALYRRQRCKWMMGNFEFAQDQAVYAAHGKHRRRYRS